MSFIALDLHVKLLNSGLFLFLDSRFRHFGGINLYTIGLLDVFSLFNFVIHFLELLLQLFLLFALSVLGVLFLINCFCLRSFLRVIFFAEY